MTGQFGVEAEVHKPLAKGYRVKASIKSLGMYINGIVVFPPDAKSNKWEFRSPAQKNGIRWSSIIEFDTSFPIWKEITEECFRAVREYTGYNSNTPPAQNSNRTLDVVPEDIDEEPIDWNSVDIPF